MREGRSAPFLPALKILSVILRLEHVLLSVLCKTMSVNLDRNDRNRRARINIRLGCVVSLWKQVAERNPRHGASANLRANKPADRERMIYRDHKSNVSTRNEQNERDREREREREERGVEG